MAPKHYTLNVDGSEQSLDHLRLKLDEGYEIIHTCSRLSVTVEEEYDDGLQSRKVTKKEVIIYTLRFKS